MSLQEGLLKIERKWAWSFFGFLLAIIFGGIAIYTSFFQDQNPNLEFVIETKTPVLDLKEDIKNLDILYKGINIKKQDKNLSVITLRVINNSNVNILKGFYDDISPLKIIVENADIVDKPQIISTSNNYLKENLKIELDSTGCIYLPKLIMEGQENYSISLLLLHKNGKSPKIISSGKIAGQKDGIPVLEIYQTSTESAYWEKLISGNIWIHLIRFVGYLFSFIIIVLTIILPTVLISEKISEYKKKKRVKNYKTKKKIENNPETDAVFELYLDKSKEYLINTQRLLVNDKKLKVVLRMIERRDKRNKNIDIDQEIYIKYNDDRMSPEVINRIRTNSNEQIVRSLKRMEMVKFESNEIQINDKFLKELNDFISYLKLI